jgi:protocatechuate 3,4-dioxygenase beta subunit
MRLRIIGLIAAVAVTLWLGYLLWPQGASVPTSAPPSRQSHSVSQAPPPPTPRPANREMQAPGTSIQGITTDTGGSPLDGTDILYQVLTVASDQHCHELPDVELELDSSTELLTSDARGHFSLPFQPITASDDHRHCLIASAHKQGYLATLVSMPLELEELPAMVEIELSPHRALHGQVVDAANHPVEGAKLIAWQAQENDGGQQRCGSDEPVATGESRARGEFTLHVADETAYCLQAFHPRWSRSQPHRVSSADLTDLRLQLGHRARVGGTVVDGRGNPLSDVTLELLAQPAGEARDRQVSRTDRNGDFVFDRLDYAPYQLTSASPEYQVAEPQEIVVTEAQAQQELTVKVFPVTVISGRVFDAFGQPLAQVAVTAYSPFSKNATLAEAVSNARGEFSLPSLHRSDVAHESFRMATAMLEGAAANPSFTGEVCLDFFHPRHGGHTLSVSTVNSTLDIGSIRLEQRLAVQIEGRVINHRARAVRATLAIRQDESQRGQALEVRIPRCQDFTLNRQVRTDAEGRFSFNVARPGTYAVEVRTDRYQTRTFDLDFAASNSNVEIRLD